jgi:hypothetical protein
MRREAVVLGETGGGEWPVCHSFAIQFSASKISERTARK